MNSIKGWMYLIRWPNLLMIFVAQWVVYLSFVFKYVESIPVFFIFLVNLATILIAIGGYVLNDIYDVTSDTFNKKNKQLLENNLSGFRKFSLLCLFTGLLIGLYTSIQTNILWWSVYIFATLMLYLYATQLSKFKFVGNFVIALLVALALVLIYLLGLDSYMLRLNWWFGLYVFSAFTLTWIRELVKDVEDIYGDKLAGRKTFPVSFGVDRTKQLTYLMLLLFCMALGYAFWVSLNGFLLVGVIIAIIIGILIAYSTQSKDYKRVSSLLKLFMFFGILVPLIFELIII